MKGAPYLRAVDQVSQAAKGPFSYFTTIEEHFRCARGTPFFLLSPCDVALVDAWERVGIPLAAVLRGIDRTFENWRKRLARDRTQMVNSLAYCAYAVAAEAQEQANTPSPTRKPTKPPFTLEDVQAFSAANAAKLRNAGLEDLAIALERLDVAAAQSCGELPLQVGQRILVTKYLRLRTPVTIGSRFDDWKVSWLGGWTRDRLSYLVMVARVSAKVVLPALPTQSGTAHHYRKRLRDEVRGPAAPRR
ncbi:MAG: hypothetical protein ABSB35_32020 [Bryobacteraceae bacterium]|jgi:hypothetical protein